ncbi:hypothetical protein KDN24_24085 [Bacillus sp. Bva_UNVM-123]|uniref:hypothetical protein n=1 Tax=Bacillus sp. Bva_UNVM-123 TaxID=2829798 RepID=UPI00391F00E9
MKMAKGNEMKKLIFGSVGAITVTTLVFCGISQSVKAVEVNKTQVVPTSYSIPYANTDNSRVPKDYVKKDYKVELVGEDKPTVNDLKMEEAAELASQNLWEVFKVDLNGKTLKMTYNPASSTQQRAIWEANVEINDMLSYAFQLDAVTGENHMIAKWIYHKEKDIREGMDINLLKNNEEYQSLAKEAVEKYQLLSGKVTSVEYSGQGYQENKLGGKNTDIFFRVRSDEGEAVQIGFSRYNKELLTVGYNSWMKETERHEKQIEQEMKENTSDLILTDEMIKKIEESGTPLLIELKN